METTPAGAAAEADASGSALRSLDRRVTRVWRVAILVRTLFFTAAAAAVQAVLNLPIPSLSLPLVIAVAGLTTFIFLPPARFRTWGYRVRDDDLFVRRGVVWRTASVIPHARIQHVDTRRGPVERWLGLSSVVVYTAGIRGADVTIPGLDHAEAEVLRDRLAAVGGGSDAV